MTEEELLHAETFRDRVSSVSAAGKRNWIYAFKPSGKFYRYRNIVSYIYLIVFFAMPFIRINGNPFFLINVIDSKFILFGKIFWPQDFFIFAVGMISFIVFIVLFTVIYGRLFCGWTCPQTVFLEFVFRKIEWWIEGSASRQKTLHDGPWTMEKIWKKGIKHTLFLIVSFLIAHTFLAYIIGVHEVTKIIGEPLSQHIALLAGLIVFTLLFYGVFAFVREIVCTTICPYGRLQGVMFDKDTMQISYDYKRGEERGKYKRNEPRTNGDCIDCKKCVVVCPTGIDIRDGVQMDCVGCTACIDACDEVMDKVGFPKGLIRYASENQITNGTPFQFNTKMKAYTVLLFVLLSAMTVMIITRKTVDTYISRVSGQLFQEMEGDKISNLFDAKIINKTNKDFAVELRIEDLQGEIKLVGAQEFMLKKEAINEFTFFLELPKTEIHNRSNKISIGVYHDGKKIQTLKTKFLGPFM
ncbi:MAG: cytochrome c oxidase accessory protein CcoG [Saprospiraceae bacterium]|uniref:Cytochrome c oxidase accessory protein CcoG n=1 Tax=Candidatus Opimibacter skivensis TaxID=2982028 RepID=A0A9D7XN15_9BACT|nr:cytochrome c oxidase accessory protein CcoG [Candidatus Opimibacter skivensis]